MSGHIFWDTQPIDISKNDINIMQPYNLPDNFEWVNLNINNDIDIIYNFLASYYVNNINALRKFHYSKDFLKWFLIQSNNIPDLLIGVKYNNKIYATIFGIPMKIKVFDKIINCIEINFLCVHHKLRNKRLTPVLIKEISRRAILHNIYQAFYTTSVDLPRSLNKGTYYHRPINVQKLIELDFIEKTNVLFNIIKKPNINIRPLQPKDFNICCEMLNKYNSQFKISILFEQEDFNYHFTFRPNIIESYVVENNNMVTDFISFFFIPSKIMNNRKYDEMKKAYVYYYFNTITPLEILMENGLYFMKKNNMDIVNCMNQYNNMNFINKLNFIEGNGKLNFYLYNYECQALNNNDIGIIMI